MGNAEIGKPPHTCQLGKAKPHIFYLASPFIAAFTTKVPLIPKLLRRCRYKAALPKAMWKMKNSERKGAASAVP